jgi:hypothetical protein
MQRAGLTGLLCDKAPCPCTIHVVIDLYPIIERIQALLNQDTEQSVTYAALEARLALEKICYDRLRQRHDYISHAQLRRWQPGAVVNTLLAEVDAHLSDTMTLYISKEPAVAGLNPQDDDFVPIGTEIGFNPKRIAKMWQALANLALHVRLPKHKNDQIPEYGDKAQVRAKIDEVVAELQLLSNGTMSFSGVPIGGDVSFVCRCGEENKRRASLLRHGQSVCCINPNCMASWKATKNSEEFTFEPETVAVACSGCTEPNLIDRRSVLAMRYDQHASFNCHECGEKNYMHWQLVQARMVPPLEEP